MKTTEEIIQALKELSPEERDKVTDSLTPENDAVFMEENYSEGDMAKIHHDAEEAAQGINVERFHSMADALKSLGLK